MLTSVLFSFARLKLNFDYKGHSAECPNAFQLKQHNGPTRL